MFAFYERVRAVDCVDPPERDQLLFQWGTWDLGAGLRFVLDITRQFMIDMGEDDDIWQLSLTLKFSPSPALRHLDSGGWWCQDFRNLPDFQSRVASSAVFRTMRDREDFEVEVLFHHAV